MAEISKITLPSGNTYELKDAYARQLIAGGVSFIVAWNGSSAPVVANIPAGVVVTYNGNNYTGTLAASSAEAGAFYLVKSSTQPETLDVYDEYVVIGSATKSWEKLGDTKLNLDDLGALAYKDNVTLSKGAGDNVLGEATTFTAASSAVSFSGGTTDKVLGSDATFKTTVTPTTTNIKATASGTAVGANGTANAITEITPGTDTFVKSYPGATSKLATTSIPNVTGNANVSIPNVTNAGSASTWAFAMGTGDDAETLVISGANGSAPTLGAALSASKVTLGTAITAATGSLSSSGSGASVMTGLGTAVTADAVTGLGTPTTTAVLTGVKVTSQPTVALATGATAGTGVVSVATGITSATTTTNAKDEVTAITSIGTATAAAQNITVGDNDKVSVAKYGDLSVTIS